MRLSIRRATEEDAPGIVEVLNPLIEAGSYTVMAGPISVDDQSAFIRSFPGRGVYHVALGRDSRKIVGLQDVMPVAPDAAYAHVGAISTFVAKDLHGQGIGRRLSEVTLPAARDRGLLKLSARIRADNPRAVAFYLGQGFRIIGTAQRHAFVRGRYIDLVLAERFLA